MTFLSPPGLGTLGDVRFPDFHLFRSGFPLVSPSAECPSLAPVLPPSDVSPARSRVRTDSCLCSFPFVFERLFDFLPRPPVVAEAFCATLARIPAFRPAPRLRGAVALILPRHASSTSTSRFALPGPRTGTLAYAPPAASRRVLWFPPGASPRSLVPPWRSRGVLGCHIPGSPLRFAAQLFASRPYGLDAQSRRFAFRPRLRSPRPGSPHTTSALRSTPAHDPRPSGPPAS